MAKEMAIPDEVIVNKIYLIRGQKVMIDKDLAQLYGVETKRLKEQVNRNLKRFPTHFMFELSQEENDVFLRSQNATLKRGAHSKYLPFVFTEHGVLMLSNVLKSNRAIEIPHPTRTGQSPAHRIRAKRRTKLTEHEPQIKRSRCKPGPYI
jgi:multidrug efflux pump subunit AcrB